MMQLPGGLIVNGERRRDFQFRELTGECELMLCEQPTPAQDDVFCHAQRVTHVLCQNLASIGGQSATRETVNALSVGDRQFLMRQLAVHIDDGVVWLTAVCGQCTEKFDVSFRHSELPVKPAGEHYPSKDIEISLGKVTVSVPTGNDQLAVVEIANQQQAMWRLITRLVRRKGRRQQLQPEQLTTEDIEQIEITAEAMSPEIATELSASCPNCQAENRLPVTPYSCFDRSADDLLNEIHTIALYYHWSEQDILALPSARRQHYIQLIDRSRGMAERHQMIHGGLHG